MNFSEAQVKCDLRSGQLQKIEFFEATEDVFGNKIPRSQPSPPPIAPPPASPPPPLKPAASEVTPKISPPSAKPEAPISSAKYELSPSSTEKMELLLSKTVQDRAISRLKAPRANGSSHTIPGSCTSYVIYALEAAGLISPSGWLAAEDTALELQRRNFKNIYAPGMTPEQAPRGAILVYSGGTNTSCIKTCGHVEIKESNGPGGRYLSDVLASSNNSHRSWMSRPVTGSGSSGSGNPANQNRPYKLIGVMIPP